MADEKKLLLRLKDKEAKAVDEAIEIYTPYLVTVLYNMVVSRLSKEDIEEIVSDVFVVLWQNVDYIDLEKGTIKSYMATTARNFALKRLNKKKDYVCIDDVELADEDKKAEKNGELVFSCGSSEVEINEVQSVNWEKDGIHYLIMQIDGKLS